MSLKFNKSYMKVIKFYKILLIIRYYLFKIIPNSKFNCSSDDLRCLVNPLSIYYNYTKIGLNTPICCKSHILEITFDISNIFEKFNIDYFAFFGTLLGIKRNNSFIPWDTDIDLIININDKEKIINIFKENEIFKKYYVQISNEKITINFSTINLSHLDIFFYKIKNNKIYFIDKDLFNSISFNLEYFYPSKKEIFESYLIKTPNDSDSILKKLYGDSYLNNVEKKYEL